MSSPLLSSLLRIGLVPLLWASIAGPMRPVHHLDSPFGLFVSALFYVASPLALFGVQSQISVALCGACTLWAWRHGLCGDLAAPFAPDRDAAALLGNAALCLALSPCGASFSFDRWRANRAHAPPPGAEREDLGRPLLRLQLTVYLVLRALDRSSLHFLSGQALRDLADTLHLDGPVPGGLATLLDGGLAAPLSLVAFALGWVAPVALWLPTTRPVALVALCATSLALYPLLPLGTEPLALCLLASVFLPAEGSAAEGAPVWRALSR